MRTDIVGSWLKYTYLQKRRAGSITLLATSTRCTRATSSWETWRYHFSFSYNVRWTIRWRFEFSAWTHNCVPVCLSVHMKEGIFLTGDPSCEQLSNVVAEAWFAWHLRAQNPDMSAILVWLTTVRMPGQSDIDERLEMEPTYVSLLACCHLKRINHCPLYT